MNKEYKTFEELKKELGDKFEEYMYKANIELLDKVNQLETNWNELKEYIRKTKIKEFEKVFGKGYGKTFAQAKIIVCNMIIEKMQKLDGGSNEQINTQNS